MENKSGYLYRLKSVVPFDIHRSNQFLAIRINKTNTNQEKAVCEILDGRDVFVYPMFDFILF